MFGRIGRWVVVAMAVLVLQLALASPAALAYQTHTVRWGDTLYKISLQYGVSVDSIREANALHSDEIRPGQTLVITGSSSSSGSGTYTVRPGDTLFLIAQWNGLSVNSLKSANGLTGDLIYVGQRLVIPPSSKDGSSGGQSSIYVVRSGDSLYTIAQSYGVSVARLKAANNLKSDSIYPGQTLSVPEKDSSGSSDSGVSQGDRDLLARLVQSEAGGEPYEGKVAVAATILNRVASSAYPNSIPGVIYHVVDGKYYQYEPVLNGTISRPASSEAFRATNAALAGWDPSLGAIGFYNPTKTTNQWVRSRPVTVRIGNHLFFR